MGRLFVVGFSKDRPFQLLHALQTCLAFVSGPSLHLIVLYSKIGSAEYAKGYEDISNKVPGAKLIIEEEGRFFEQLQEALEEAEEGDAIMWLVDDLLFYRPFDANAALEVLRHDATVWAVHPKLHPGIVYSHTQDKVFSVPPLCYSPSLRDQGFVYDRQEAEGEWDYPWDLCGSIYRATGDCEGPGHPSLLVEPDALPRSHCAVPAPPQREGGRDCRAQHPRRLPGQRHPLLPPPPQAQQGDGLAHYFRGEGLAAIVRGRHQASR